MTFAETLTYLDELSETKMRLDLEPTIRLLAALDRPDRKLKSIIVAGTNGKGSTCAFLTAIAKAGGLRVGTYTSPHLESPTERIAIDGAPISEETFAAVATDLRRRLYDAQIESISYFEFLTMMAIEHFAAIAVDLAILEVGLGGRLDSTNACERIGVVLTRIDLDHIKILGSTLPQIAAEKAAIMRKDIPAVIAPQAPEARNVFEQHAAAVGAHWIEADRDFRGTGNAHAFAFQYGPIHFGPLRLGIRGDHQVENAATAAATAIALRRQGINLSTDAIQRGLESASISGRLESWRSSDGREVWLDLGHNPSAIRALVRYFQKEKLTPIDLVIGILEDKDWKTMVEELRPLGGRIILTQPRSPRAWDLDRVRASLADMEKVETVPEPIDAISHALTFSRRILCTGSTYTIGPIRTYLNSGTHA